MEVPLCEILVLQLQIIKILINHPDLVEKIDAIVGADDDLFGKLQELVSKIDSLQTL
jgi:hypothetical protein